jgi:transposase-like protein
MKPSLNALLKQQYCHNEACANYGKVGQNLGIYSRKQRQVYCQVCRNSFTVRKGTFLYRIRTPLKQVVRVFHLLVEGMSIRGIERVEGIKQDTILAWLRKAGQHVEEVNALLIHHLHLTQVQIDEFWSFVKKRKNMSILSTTIPRQSAISGGG